MSEIDNIIGGLQRMSDAGYLRDLVFYANEAAKKRCGSCCFWMKSRDCPAERNVGGMRRGPSSSALPCAKFQITDSSLQLAERKRSEANAFAAEKGFPAPFTQEVLS